MTVRYEVDEYMQAFRNKVKMNIRVSPIEKENIDRVKFIINSVLPVTYPDSIYKNLSDGKLSGLVAEMGGKSVGCIIWKKDHQGKTNILALGVLVLYREKGVASILLSKCLDGCKDAYLHVQTDNIDAIQFYKHRGFRIEQTINNYYKRITCTDAFEMIKE